MWIVRENWDRSPSSTEGQKQQGGDGVSGVSEVAVLMKRPVQLQELFQENDRGRQKSLLETLNKKICLSYCDENEHALGNKDCVTILVSHCLFSVS